MPVTQLSVPHVTDEGKLMAQIVIIGNSAAGFSALETFRKQDQTSKVTVIAKEGHRPYSKVLLPPAAATN